MIFKNRTLLAVTGLSPQIVTETLYALFMQYGADNMPNKIKLLTTIEGAKRARLTLLQENTGHFHRFLNEYSLAGKVSFIADDIEVIKSQDGKLLDDILTPDDNAAAADCITDLMRQLTQEEDSQLHVSIAGGRKTMGFYLGYAFSLFARPQDVLSHVLVSSPFESHPEFYFPPKNGVVLYTQDKTPIHTDDARIWLAEIPVVKLRHGVPTEQLQKEIKYSDAVSEIDKSLKPANVEIDIPKKSIKCDGVSLNFKKYHLIWYVHLMLCKKSGKKVQLDDSLFDALCLTGAQILPGVGEAGEIFNCFNPEKKDFESYTDFEEMLKRVRSENSKIKTKLTKKIPFSYPHYLVATKGKKNNYEFYVAVEPENISIKY